MSRVLVSRYEIEKIRANHFDRISEGFEGSCYYVNYDKVIKLFHIPNINQKIYFEGYQSNYIAFPIDIYYYEDSSLIAGYTMNYFLGNNISRGLKESLLIDKLLLAYNKIRCEIEKYPNIYMNDLVTCNILYDYKNNQINLIDTNSWYPKKNSLARNISRINAELIDALLYDIKFLISDLEKKPQLLKLYQEYKDILQGYRYFDSIFDLDLFERFLDELIKIVQNEQEKIETIGDLRPKVLKKS